MALALLPAVVEAQTRPATPPEVLQSRRTDKLASPFLKRYAWHSDFAAAQREAARTGRPIFCHFTRSFVPCGTSIRCEHEILDTPEFGRIAKRAVLYCHVTARLDSEHDAALYRAHGHGWPHHIVTDATGRRLARHTGDKSVASFEQLLDTASAVQRADLEYRSKIARATKVYFETALRAGALRLDEAQAMFSTLPELSASERKRMCAELVDLEVRTIAERNDRFDTEAQKAAGAELYSMYRQRKRPSGRDAKRDFWGGIMLYIESQPRPRLEAYDEALAAFAAEFGAARGYRRFLEARQAWREGIKKADPAVGASPSTPTQASPTKPGPAKNSAARSNAVL